MTEWYHRPPDFANAVYEEPDPPLAEQVADAMRQFFRGRDDVDSFREVIEQVSASVTAQRGRAPDGRPVLRLRMVEPGRDHDYSYGAPHHDPADVAARHGIDVARELLDVLLPNRVRAVQFNPEIGAEHPLWTEYGQLEWLEDPDLGLSEDLRHALEAWAPGAAEDSDHADARLNEEGARLFERVRSELSTRYTLVDRWRIGD